MFLLKYNFICHCQLCLIILFSKIVTVFSLPKFTWCRDLQLAIPNEALGKMAWEHPSFMKWDGNLGIFCPLLCTFGDFVHSTVIIFSPTYA